MHKKLKQNKLYMKKIFSVALLFAFVFASANTAIAADKAEHKTPHVKGFVSNGFWDNWEIQAGVGPTFNMGTGSGISNSVLAGAYIGVGKWFHPVFGVRVAGEGGKYTHTQLNGNECNWSFLFIHPDFMVDMTNWIGGYKDKRIWNSILYLGAGVGVSALNSPGDRTVQFVGNLGWQNRFRVCKAVSIDLTLEYLLADSQFRPTTCTKSNRFHGLNVYVGATYRFNKRTYNRSGATENEAKAMLANLKKSQDEAAAAKDKSDKLQALADEQAKALATAEQLAAEQAEALKNAKKDKPQAASAKEAVDTDNYDEMLFYAYGYSTLSSTNKKRLDLIAEHIKASDKQVFRVDGFADKQTGSQKANERLAGKRARIAADYLVSKGVDRSRLDVRNCGTTDCPFGKPSHNRIVVVY